VDRRGYNTRFHPPEEYGTTRSSGRRLSADVSIALIAPNTRVEMTVAVHGPKSLIWKSALFDLWGVPPRFYGTKNTRTAYLNLSEHCLEG